MDREVSVAGRAVERGVDIGLEVPVPRSELATGAQRPTAVEVRAREVLGVLHQLVIDPIDEIAAQRRRRYEARDRKSHRDEQSRRYDEPNSQRHPVDDAKHGYVRGSRKV